MKYKVIGTKGIMYTEPNQTNIKVFEVGSTITKGDIDRGCITKGGLERLAKDKRIKLMPESEAEKTNDNKIKIENLDNKMAKVENKKG